MTVRELKDILSKRDDKKENNALAELAEDLKYIADWAKRGYVFTKIRKAQRIVAELAKVRCHAPFDEIPFDRDTNLAYRNCRAIAEERVKDGQ